MNEYLEALEIIAKRLYGVYGVRKTKEFFKKHGIILDDSGKVVKYNRGENFKDLLIKILSDIESEFGIVSKITTKTALISYFVKKNIPIEQFKNILY